MPRCSMDNSPKIAFITNFCSHYRRKTFEVFSAYFPTEFFFYSAGDEWYWQQQHGTKSGNFQYQYLPGFRLGQTRITLTLPWKLLKGDYGIYIKCINGKFALPITFLLARLQRKPFILWTGIWMRLTTRTHRLIFPFTHYIYQHSDAIVTYGEHVKQYLISEGVPAKKIFTTTHAVDNEMYQKLVPVETLKEIREKHNIGPKDKIILYLGRLEESKGVEYLVKAFSKINLPDTILIIAGNGSVIEFIKDSFRGIKGK